MNDVTGCTTTWHAEFRDPKFSYYTLYSLSMVVETVLTQYFYDPGTLPSSAN